MKINEKLDELYLSKVRVHLHIGDHLVARCLGPLQVMGEGFYCVTNTHGEICFDLTDTITFGNPISDEIAHINVTPNKHKL